MSWLEEEEKKANETKGRLPNEQAPKLVTREVVAEEMKKKAQLDQLAKQKKPVQLLVPAPVHKELTRLVALDKLAGGNAAITSILMKGLDLYLKKRGLPTTDEMILGHEITEETATMKREKA